MDSAKAELADKLKAANNILVTVSRNPSVDQLSACIGLTLLLNKMGKHAAAVFSGQVPSTLEFLKPEETLEKNTDSLRDFIIALDKSKADKLRYKVEDNVVRIFITPYKTSISQADLEFSQGDFNVDVVVALGVQRQEDLDEAITAHGRILHDAVVASMNITAEGGLGSLNWHEPHASSLSELVTSLSQNIGDNLLDGQIATALLTGIVAETHRFSNEKTSSQTMSASAALMAAGANQQLVATKLDEPNSPETGNQGANLPKPDGSPVTGGEAPKSDDGTLEIEHGSSGKPTDVTPDAAQNQSNEPLPEMSLPIVPPEEAEKPDLPYVEPLLSTDGVSPGGKLMTEAPSMGGMLTANTVPEGDGQTADQLGTPSDGGPLLDHSVIEPQPFADQTPEPHEEPKIDEVKATGSSADFVMAAETIDSQPEPPTPLPTPPTSKPTSSSLTMGSFTPPPPAWVPPQTDPLNLGLTDDGEPKQTLTDIEESVHSTHIEGDPEPAQPADDSANNSLAAARDEVSRALNSTAQAPEVIQALNAQPLGDALHPANMVVTGDSEHEMPLGFSSDPNAHLEPSSAPTLPASPITASQDSSMSPPIDASAPQVSDPTAPPPVPPPIPFQFRPPGQ